MYQSATRMIVTIAVAGLVCCAVCDCNPLPLIVAAAAAWATWQVAKGLGS
jgi:hypothetical protein